MTRQSAPAAALVSGGPDSAVMLDLLARRYGSVTPVYVRFGLRWEPAELGHLKRFLASAGIPRVKPLVVVWMPLKDAYSSHWSLSGSGVPGPLSRDRAMYLPGRNVLLLAAAAPACAARGIRLIAEGTLAGNPFRDATPLFRRLMGRALSLSFEKQFRIIAPLSGMSKPEAMRQGKHLPLHATFSCVSPVKGRHCGRCNKCAERRRSFRAAGLKDRTFYEKTA